MTSSPGLGVAVIAYGAAPLLRSALEPLRRRFPVVVVDNSSDPEVRAVTVAAGAEYDDPGTNLGFAAGVNRAVALLRERTGPVDVLVLNPDASIDVEAVLLLHQRLRQDERTGLLSPALVDRDGRRQRVGWPFPTPAGLWREAIGLQRRTAPESEWMSGAVMLVRSEAWDDVGPFDERFFLYAEETDWQRRAAAAGWGLTEVVGVTAMHVGAATSASSVRREALFHAGTETYVRKWFGARGWQSYRAAAVTGALLRSPAPGGRGAAARRRVLLYVRGPRRSAGLSGTPARRWRPRRGP